MRRRCRRDTNEKEIVEALRKIGATVEFLDLTNGPDLLVGYHGENFLLEVKQPKKDLRSEQVDWHNHWNGSAFIVRDVEDATFWVAFRSMKGKNESYKSIGTERQGRR